MITLSQLFGGRKKVSVILGIGLSALILGEIGWFAFAPSRSPVTEPIEPQDALAMLGIDDSSPPKEPALAKFNEVIRRPVFDPSRKPVVKVQAAKAGLTGAAELARKWRLTGVVISDERSFAMLEDQKTGKAVAVDLEASLDGWQLIDIRDDEISFRSAQGLAELSLYRKGGPDPNGAAARNGVLVRKSG
jgi:hypothetical protein